MKKNAKIRKITSTHQQQINIKLDLVPQQGTKNENRKENKIDFSFPFLQAIDKCPKNGIEYNKCTRE